ncbi:MAG TPA: 1-deoxy-D-xylulose-5-phosphate reductoisomerase [Candidatus Merdivicinus excrementipullorum]|uniref:1-deoxy-D-xylulose 5-phosphate reductoisomerase n=1 Tax=Candidatus Merdivicinus excrementipullorum TaxID=2840867 RepID=A0A9D1K0M0_9FIRM|nr:1-deoxy-D-xylulose-5-phosphate reductoisomerase [Candidatus Merdivicinus excrementipullorum]
MEHQPITILGSTGSIGTQALEVCENNRILVKGLAAFSNEVLLEEQARRFHPEQVCIYSEKHYSSMKKRLADTDVRVVSGMEGLCETAALSGTGTCLNSVVGMVGLQPTLAAIEAGKTIALANKETLVTGGELVMQSAKEKGVRILPVDSEHSAIFQCLQGYSGRELNKILLTASGGPFFGKTREELARVTVEQALRHPNWSMGAKITIDSATLMNKGFECIEAVWLFEVKSSQIQVLVHRESVIHSMVEFCDHAVLAQLGAPDMKIPIQYALTYPERLPCAVKPLDLLEYGSLTFAKPDLDTFPCLGAALKAIEMGGLYPTLVNSANEELVRLFLDGKIPFLQIGDTVSRMLELSAGQEVTVASVLEAEKAAREAVHSICGVA